MVPVPAGRAGRDVHPSLSPGRDAGRLARGPGIPSEAGMTIFEKAAARVRERIYDQLVFRPTERVQKRHDKLIADALRRAFTRGVREGIFR